jgi:hypothetical protein
MVGRGKRASWGFALSEEDDELEGEYDDDFDEGWEEDFEGDDSE